MAKMYSTEPFKGPLMRLSYAWQLFKPREGRYGCTLIAPKSGDWSSIQGAIVEVVKGQWGEKGAGKWKAGLIKSPILDGAGKQARSKESGELHPGMGEDVQFIRVYSGEKYPPRVFDPPMKRCSVVKEGQPYLLLESDDCPSGSWGYPVLNAFAWHNDDSGDGVGLGMEMFHVTKFAEGDDILGGGGGSHTNPNAFFEAVKGAGDGPEPNSAEDMFA